MDRRTALKTYLDRECTNPIRDPLWKHIYLSPALERLTRTAPFLRLGRILQLGPAVMVYPGASHSRMNHSLGVLHLAKRFMETLIRWPEAPDLSLEGLKAFLCAALLHDLGHFPYAHVLEDDLALEPHEGLSARYVLQPELARAISGDVGTDPAMVAAIIDKRLEYSQAPEEVNFYRRLLSGVLDPDKLDYLNRDAYFCGIPYGIQDIDFIISQIQPHPEKGLALPLKGVTAVENILFSKYLMYKSVYWHKGVRAPSSIVKKALGLALEQGALAAEELYPLDDTSFIPLMIGKDHGALGDLALTQQPGHYQSLWEEPWNLEGPLGFLNHRTTRLAFEKDLARLLGRAAGREIRETEITLDIPRAISFEVNLPIRHRGREIPFTESGTAFRAELVKGFTDSLKHIRLIGPADLRERISNPEDILYDMLGGPHESP